MSAGDIRKCSFCLKEYTVTKHHSRLQVCLSCKSRHLNSKNKNLSSNRKNSNLKDMESHRKLHKNSFAKPLPDVKVSLNWLAPKITEKAK